MLKHSQKLSDGLIVYSVLVSDFEKLDFKSDALAGVRANYFNSKNSAQREKTEIELDGKIYKLSYTMQSGSPLLWKVTRDNLPYQSVKRATGGVYCVMFYAENGIIYKRQYFDSNHYWLRTEYFDMFFSDKLLCRIYPEKINRVTVLTVEKNNENGAKTVLRLYPSEKFDKDSSVLIYSNIGMLWYDAKFKPEDMPEYDSCPAQNEGFSFRKESFKSDYEPDTPFDLLSAEYLEASEAVLEQIEDQIEEEQINCSAYDKIEKILTEAHKTNKDLFGEIMLHTADDNYSEPQQEEEINDKEAEKAFDEQAQSDAEEIEVTEITVQTEEIPTENSIDDAEEENTVEEITEISEDNEDNITKESTSEDSTSDGALDDNFEASEMPPCDAVIITKSGRYTYYGELDKNNCRTGRGRTAAPDGLTSYDGEYVDDLRSGFGVCYYKDGSINYVGNWADNNRHGSGVGYRQSDGTMHAGKWNNNTPDGYGARFTSDGELLDVCMYKDGIRSGKSVSFDEDGNIIVAVYENGEKVNEYTIDED